MSSPSPPPQFNAFYDAVNTPAPPAYAFNTRVMVGAIVVLFFVIFFILMLHVYARWFLQRSSSSYFVSRRTTFSSLAGAAPSAHTNTGLDKTVIAQLPTFVYTALTSPLDNLEAGKLDESVARPSSECSVCLSEFQENEKVRMLPSCKHIFHTECIDMWFFSHSTCPLCRTKVGPATATSASTDPQHQGQEAMETSPGTAEGNPVGSQAVEYPCNVLFWGNSAQVVSSQEPSSSTLPLSPSLRMPGARSVPQITIDIPPIEGNLPVSASSGSLSAKGKMEQEASSSQAIKSPGLRASIKRMLSRQSSRHKTSGQEGCAESPK